MTDTNTTPVALAALALACAGAGADIPSIHGTPMEHVLITFDGGAVGVELDNPGAVVEMRRFEGVSYDGAASVLDETYYSDQFGWLADGFISLGAGEHIWIERTASSQGLDVYEGGMRMMRETHSYDPILGTAGSDARWMWGGTMTHHWHSADGLGAYEADYEVYIGDARGDALAQYGSASVTLSFNAVPAPGALGVLVLGALGAARHRGGRS